MEILDTLFTFPIVMVDGRTEEKRKEKGNLFGGEEDEDPEIVYGEASVPYYDFFSVTDRWLPTTRSFNKAQKGKFEACFVIFKTAGAFIVPWPKAEYLEKLREFGAEKEEKGEVFEIPVGDKEKLLKFLRDGGE